MTPDNPTDSLPQPVTLPAEPQAIGLTLSGGGFRATLFHLGVVRLLADAGLLARVKHICSVSGGSILAAHLVLNWDRYNGAPAQFEAAAEELLGFIRADIRGRIVRRWLVSCASLWRCLPWGRRGRTALLEAHYSTLFQRQTLNALKGRNGQDPPPPSVDLLTTSMTTGRLCWFNKEGFWGEQPRDQSDDAL